MKVNHISVIFLLCYYYYAWNFVKYFREIGTINTLQMKYEYLENAYMYGKSKSEVIKLNSGIVLASVRGDNSEGLSENLSPFGS